MVTLLRLRFPIEGGQFDPCGSPHEGHSSSPPSWRTWFSIAQFKAKLSKRVIHTLLNHIRTKMGEKKSKESTKRQEGLARSIALNAVLDTIA